MTPKSSPGPSLAPYVGGTGPSTNLAVPPVMREPGVARLLSMIRARPRARRPLQLTAQCNQDRDHTSGQGGSFGCEKQDTTTEVA